MGKPARVNIQAKISSKCESAMIIRVPGAGVSSGRHTGNRTKSLSASVDMELNSQRAH